jgi:hypothetical protein
MSAIVKKPFNRVKTDDDKGRVSFAVQADFEGVFPIGDAF